MMQRKFSIEVRLMITLFFLIGLIQSDFGQSGIISNSSEQKINDLLKKMTLEEKVSLLHGNSSFTSAGIPRLGIPELVLSDGPHGVRTEHGRGWGEIKNVHDSGTYLPTGIALASTWNTGLSNLYGTVLGSEAKFRGKNIILGPGINIMRSPLNGRNFEYLSEDPFLTSRMAVAYIKGVQSQGVSACVKHFAANNEETDRNSVDIQMSERALQEIYLPAFKASVVEAKVNCVMAAYNKFRGDFCTQNAYLLQHILKGQWDFRGILVSDWGAVHGTKPALLNGTDLEMGTDLVLSGSNIAQSGVKKTSSSIYDRFYFADSAILLVKNGTIPIAVIDDKVKRILRVMFQSSVFSKSSPGEYGSDQHIRVAKKVAEESIVLLKNDGHLLPIDSLKVQSIAVIGSNAIRKNALGGGSSQVRPVYEITPLDGLRNVAGNISYQFAKGYTISRDAKADSNLIKEAVDVAKKSDVAIVVGGWTHGFDYNNWGDNAYDAEGVDKPDMKMPFGQDELINAVVAANPNTIVVLVGGGPIDMSAWVGKVKGIISCWYGGMEGGNALAAMILGRINPSGKLPVTFPKKLEDAPAHKIGDFLGKNGLAVYRDDIFVGYRYFDTYRIEPQFAFGHGLSYTTFSYSDLQISNHPSSDVTVRFTLTNTGQYSGAEVAQLYVHKEHSKVTRPDKELKGFQKIFLKPGESQMVTIKLGREAFQYFDETSGKWSIEPGTYLIRVGGASDCANLTSSLQL